MKKNYVGNKIVYKNSTGIIVIINKYDCLVAFPLNNNFGWDFNSYHEEEEIKERILSDFPGFDLTKHKYYWINKEYVDDYFKNAKVLSNE